jgi:Undecaprenyl-phosphate glucose phosphotransferase
MIRGQRKRVQFFLTVSVFSIPLAAFSVSGYLRFGTHLLPRYSSDADPYPYFGFLLLTTIVWVISSEHYQLTSLEFSLQSANKLRRSILACLLTYAGVLSATFFYRQATFSRLFVWISALNIFILAVLIPELFRWSWNRRVASGKPAVVLLIVGADEFAMRTATALASSQASCAIKGHIRLPGQTVAVKDYPVFELSEAEQLAVGNGFTDLIVAIPPQRLVELSELRVRLASFCVPMRLVLDLCDSALLGPSPICLGNLLLLDLQATPADSTLYVVLKRAFDVAFSTAVLLLAAPVFLLIAVVIRLTSAGPVVFVQDRVGLSGKLFRMYKFRTMTVGSAEESDRRWTVKNDPRCTRFGKILRRTGLDELPQFVNALLGDMSVVGPRPERPILVQRFMQTVGNYNTRHFLKVGITGWAQVNGWRGDTSIEKRIEYDLYYMRHWTLGFDLLIVILTFFRGFKNRNAY